MSRRNSDDLRSLMELMKATLAPQGLPTPSQQVGEAAAGAKEIVTMAITAAASTEVIPAPEEAPGVRAARPHAEGGERGGGSSVPVSPGDAVRRAGQGSGQPNHGTGVLPTPTAQELAAMRGKAKLSGYDSVGGEMGFEPMSSKAGRGRVQGNRGPTERRADWARSAEEISLIDQSREWAESDPQGRPWASDHHPNRLGLVRGWSDREGRPGMGRGQPE
ncbi:unnamed protein product [Linum trigynum]|uniref:Uncharacterized protein n=1 Tax=Linum trigynum TaxID=586398 RepID=A0AAV2FRP0_9ROSI